MDGITKPNPLFPSIFLSLIFLALPITFSTPLQNLTFFPASLTRLPQIQSHPTTLPKFGRDPVISLPLIHVDRFHPTKSAHERLRHRLDRDVRRVLVLSAGHAPVSLNSSVYSGFLQGTGEFFTRLMVGNPAQPVQLAVDTGSDLTWFQCRPCNFCYKQTGALFDPAQSNSFELVTCGSELCSFQKPNGCNQNKTCLYRVDYGDDSYTEGQLATDTLTFRTRRVARVVLGCGYRNKGLFAGANGILGLGRGKVSFPVRKGYLFNRTFSYCLVNLLSSTDSSWLMFGKAAISREAVFTPMVINELDDSFYKVHLTEILVGGDTVSLPAPMDVIVDSGTSISRLGQGVYTALRDAFRVGNKDLKLVDSPFPGLLDTCFNMSGREEMNVTTVEFGFEGGARMVLPVANFLLPCDEGIFCFAMAGTMDRLSILGNIQQQGFRFVFDLEGKRVGIAPDSCT